MNNINKINKLEEIINNKYNKLDRLYEKKNPLSAQEKQILKDKKVVNDEFKKYTNIINLPNNNTPKIQEERLKLFEQLKDLEIARQNVRKQINEIDIEIRTIQNNIIDLKTEIQILSHEMIKQFEKPNYDYNDYDLENPIFIDPAKEVVEHINEYEFDM